MAIADPAHEEHDSIALPPGSYRVLRQREYEPQTQRAWRTVAHAHTAHMVNVLRIDHRSVTVAVSESWTSRAGCAVISSCLRS